mgnify:CR=1 FL=1
MEVLMEMLTEISLESLSGEWMAKQTDQMTEMGWAQLSEMSLECLLAGQMAMPKDPAMAQMRQLPKDLLRVQNSIKTQSHNRFCPHHFSETSNILPLGKFQSSLDS